MSIRRACLLIFAALVLFISTGASGATDLRRDAPRSSENIATGSSVHPLRTAFPVSNLSDIAERQPALAYNTVHDEYMAVWDSFESGMYYLMGQRFSAEGGLLGDIFYVAVGGGINDRRYPRIAYNPTEDQYLVVWAQYEPVIGYSIQGTRLTWSGANIDPQYITIQPPGDGAYYPFTPAVAYASNVNKYLVVWQEVWDDDTIYNNIYGRVVLNSGALGSGLINITQTDSNYPLSNPDLAYNPVTNWYLVVWQQYEYGIGLYDIWGKLVNGNGDVYSPAPLPIGLFNNSSTSPSIAALDWPFDGSYLVVFESQYSPDKDIHGQLVNSDGTHSPSYLTISSIVGTDESEPNVAANLSGRGFLVAWKVANPTFPISFTYAREIKYTGENAGDPFILGGISAENPRVVSGAHGDFALVYDDVNFNLDWGIYGWIFGNRQYAPFILR